MKARFNALHRLISVGTSTLAVCAAGALSACGGSDDKQAPPPPAPELTITSANYVDVAAIVAAGLEQSAVFAAAGAISLDPAFAMAAPGSIACAKGGSMTLALDGQKRVFTAVDCQTEHFTLVSGSLTESPVEPGTANEKSFELKDMNLRIAGADTSVVGLNGIFYSPKKPLVSTVAFVGDVKVTRSGRSDNYAITVKTDESLLLVVTTPRVKDKLVVTTDILAKTVAAKSRSDGSGVTLKESADGKSMALELRGPGNDAVIQIKNLTEAEFDALVAKSK